jgi:membrane protein implicated in regulation of membrane protease activity
VEILQLGYWFYFAQVWVAIGLLFIILEITDGSAIFFLPLGLAGFILGLILFLVENNFLLPSLVPDKWYWILVSWIILSVIIAFLISFLKKKPKEDSDINQY